MTFDVAFPSSLPSILILIVTVILVVLRPGGLNEGLAAALGAVAAIAVGGATVDDAQRGFAETAQVLAFLLAMMVVATIAYEAGCFDWAAGRAVALANRRGLVLFLNLYLLGALVTVFLSLDVTAIIIAPIVCAIVRRARLPALPFVLSCAYVANNASLFLPVSNLTNMLVYGILRVPFWPFVALLTAPNLAAMLVNLLAFLALFARQIPARFTLLEGTSEPSAGTTRFRIAAGGLIATVIGLLAFGGLGWPLYIPAVAVALGFGAIALWRGDVSARQLRAGIAWSLPPFVVGMYVVVVAANRAGLGQALAALLAGDGARWTLPRLLEVTSIAALGSNLVNNLPMALVVITGLETSGRAAAVAPAFAGLIGTNVGPNVTVFGSLATMLVLRSARKYGLRIRPASYVAIGLLTVPAMLVVATAVLWLELR